MVTCPTVHGPSATVAQLRAFFNDPHVHAALLVDADKLIGVIERADLGAGLSDDAPARTIARLEGRTTHPTQSIPGLLHAMTRTGRRRLAVVSDDGALLGLLCLKASGQGFCSDTDVRSRTLDGSHDRPGAPARNQSRA
jgi:CBS domain-containing protein